jgi:hypothetical protein
MANRPIGDARAAESSNRQIVHVPIESPDRPDCQSPNSRKIGRLTIGNVHQRGAGPIARAGLPDGDH